MSTEMLAAALAYAGHGWPVFVLSSSKVPVSKCSTCSKEGIHDTAAEMEACSCLLCHGFYAATTDPDRITAMIDRHPRGLLAIRTGAVSGLAVVDVDIRNWVGQWPAPDDPAYLTMSELDRRRLLPGTLMQTTGSGSLHLLYAHPGQGDYLLSGGGKYGPYAWTPDGRFDHPLTPMPEALAAMVRLPAVASFVSARRPTGRRGIRTRLGSLVAAVLDAPIGQRNAILHWAAARAGEMVAAGEIDRATAVAVLQDAASEVGLTATETGNDIRGTIGSGLRKGLTGARSAS